MSPRESSDSLVAEARTLAHDLRNLLNPLSLQIELLERRVADDGRSLQVLEAMREVLQRADVEIGRLRSLADRLRDG